jgi:hypothetical protein
MDVAHAAGWDTTTVDQPGLNARPCKPGDRIGVLLTLGEGFVQDAGSVLFFKNGTRFGGEALKYPGGSVDKPVVLAVQLASEVTPHSYILAPLMSYNFDWCLPLFRVLQSGCSQTHEFRSHVFAPNLHASHQQQGPKGKGSTQQTRTLLVLQTTGLTQTTLQSRRSSCHGSEFIIMPMAQTSEGN